MSDYQSFQSYQAQPQETPQTLRPVIDADAGQTSRVIIRDGVAVTDHTSSAAVRSSELNPHFNDGTVFASARSMHGMGVQEIGPDTLITIAGVQGTVRFFEKEGLVHRAADGSYAEGSGDPQEAAEEAPKVDTADDLSMPSEVVAAVDQALEGVSDANITPLVGLGIGVATGQVDRAHLEQQLQRFSGASPEEAGARVSMIEAAYQQQANAAITARSGVAEADLGDFYEWAKESQGGALRGAIEKQIHSNDFSGYRSLAARYLAECPPSLNAVKAAGYQVRTEGAQAEVLMDGRWLTIATAARLGYF